MATRTKNINGIDVEINSDKFRVKGMSNWIWIGHQPDETIAQMVRSLQQQMFAEVVTQAKQTMMKRAVQDIEVIFSAIVPRLGD